DGRWVDRNLYRQLQQIAAPVTVCHGRPNAPHQSSVQYLAQCSLSESEVECHYAGKKDVKCSYCGALFWDAEKCSGSTVATPKFGTQCCQDGKVTLPPLAPPPDALHKLLPFSHHNQLSAQDAALTKEFYANIHSYNNAWSF